MSKKSLYVIIGILAAVLIISLYFNKELYFAANRLADAENTVKGLIKSGQVREGDIIFQTSRSHQGIAIEKATHSDFSHCGLVLKNTVGYYVLEAVQPVKRTPLAEWIAKGRQNHFAIKRLKSADAVLTNSVMNKMKASGDSMVGRNYDAYFGWGDDSLYCSELVWKIYQRSTGLQLGRLQALKDFDLSSETVQKKLKARYNGHIPLDEKVISPEAIYNSDLLISEASNY